MSNFTDGLSSTNGSIADDKAWYDTLVASYPNLALALRGSPGGPTGAGKLPPMTLGLSKKDGHLRFTLYSPDASRTYFGPQIEANELLEGVERSLAENLGEWGPPKKNGDGRQR